MKDKDKVIIIVARVVNALMFGLFVGTAISTVNHASDLHKVVFFFTAGYWLAVGLFVLKERR